MNDEKLNFMIWLLEDEFGYSTVMNESGEFTDPETLAAYRAWLRRASL